MYAKLFVCKVINLLNVLYVMDSPLLMLWPRLPGVY